MEVSHFVWDTKKELANILKHGIDFETASKVFKDPKRKVYADAAHRKEEERLFCVGKVDEKVLTVRFVYREDKIRIIGAGLWRKGRRAYEKEKT